MTKRLDPEVKAQRAIKRATRGLDAAAKDRIAAWFQSRVKGELRAKEEADRD